jgi:hypothetical protein
VVTLVKIQFFKILRENDQGITDKQDIGWRVEFRSMEIQITDFENAAFSIFIVLVTRAILSTRTMKMLNAAFSKSVIWISIDRNSTLQPISSLSGMEGGMDDLLATHFAHLFIRDPLVIFSEDLEELDIND